MINQNSPLEEIEQARTEKQQELQEIDKEYEKIANERHDLQLQILKLRIKIKELDIPFEMEKTKKDIVRSQVKVLENWFWSRKTT